jgi:hypothetical protein
MEPATPKPKLPRTAADRRYHVFVAVCLVAAAVTMYFAIHLTNTDQDEPADVSAAPKIVEQLIPPKDSQQLRQSELGIDLAPGYEASLIVNGIAIPRDELREVPQQNQVFFTPGKGKVIEELEGGQVCVTAIVWASANGRGPNDQSFNWCFGVT